VGGAAAVEDRHAYENDTRCIYSIYIGGRESHCPFNSCAKTVFREKLREHACWYSVEFGTASNTQDWKFSPPVPSQVFGQKNWQIERCILAYGVDS
jgi:hypothetical protein